MGLGLEKFPNFKPFGRASGGAMAMATTQPK